MTLSVISRCQWPKSSVAKWEGPRYDFQLWTCSLFPASHSPSVHNAGDERLRLKLIIHTSSRGANNHVIKSDQSDCTYCHPTGPQSQLGRQWRHQSSRRRYKVPQKYAWLAPTLHWLHPHTCRPASPLLCSRGSAYWWIQRPPTAVCVYDSGEDST